MLRALHARRSSWAARCHCRWQLVTTVPATCAAPESSLQTQALREQQQQQQPVRSAAAAGEVLLSAALRAAAAGSSSSSSSSQRGVVCTAQHTQAKCACSSSTLPCPSLSAVLSVARLLTATSAVTPASHRKSTRRANPFTHQALTGLRAPAPVLVSVARACASLGTAAVDLSASSRRDGCAAVSQTALPRCLPAGEVGQQQSRTPVPAQTKPNYRQDNRAQAMLPCCKLLSACWRAAAQPILRQQVPQTRLYSSSTAAARVCGPTASLQGCAPLRLCC